MAETLKDATAKSAHGAGQKPTDNLVWRDSGADR